MTSTISRLSSPPRPRRRWWLVLAGLLLLMFASPLRVVRATAAVVLAFEAQALDLDTYQVVEETLPFDVLESYPGADLLIGYHADRTPHAVLVPNSLTGVEMAYLADTPFDSVTAADLPGLTFTTEMVDEPFGPGVTIVVRSDAGATYKLGNALESAQGLSFDVEQLDSGAAGGATYPTGRRIDGKTSGDAGFLSPPTKQLGLARGAWRQIQPAVLYGQNSRVIGYGSAATLAALMSILVGGGLLLAGRGTPARRMVPVRATRLLPTLLLALTLSAGARAAQVTEQGKLVAADGGISDLLGYAVDVSGDTAIVGAWGKDGQSGAAYIFRRTGTSWSQEAKLTPSDHDVGNQFGWSVAIEGNTALVGSPGVGPRGHNSGSAYVFERVGTLWSEQARLIPLDGASFDLAGISVGLQDDTAIVGAYLDDDNDTDSGSAYIFRRSGTTWSEEAKLLAADGVRRDAFGYATDVWGDTAIVGAFREDARGTASGSAYVFERTGSTWSQRVKLDASDGQPLDRFGLSVAIQLDTALIGAPLEDERGLDAGAAYLYERVGTSWSETVKLSAMNGAAGDWFGQSVALDGGLAAIGTPSSDVGVGHTGSVYLFRRAGSLWTQEAQLVASDAQSAALMGISTALDDQTVVAGAYTDDAPAVNSGSAYVFHVVTNAPPVAEAGGPYAGDEGSAILLDASASSDPDGDPLTYLWSVDTPLCSFNDPTSAGPTLTCTDDSGSTPFEVTLEVDDGNAVASDSALLTVSNVAPQVTAVDIPLAPIDIDNQAGQYVEVAFADPGSDAPYSCAFDLDLDGQVDSTSSGVVGSSCSTPLVYAEPGVYSVGVSVTDADGAVGSATATGYIVVYDPEGGFVTGGGWINSPAGAYSADPLLTGRANFGFVSKYRKGASVPTGNTEFNFSAGDFNFHSDSYHWLVINQGGSRAQYRGHGWVNGEVAPNGALYSFMIWATDDALDLFRIKIWYDENGEHVVYDNGTEQPIGGGNIRVHE